MGIIFLALILWTAEPGVGLGSLAPWGAGETSTAEISFPILNSHTGVGIILFYISTTPTILNMPSSLYS